MRKVSKEYWNYKGERDLKNRKSSYIMLKPFSASIFDK